jgi:hypothetical protein
MPSLKIPSAFSNRRFYCIFKPALTGGDLLHRSLARSHEAGVVRAKEVEVSAKRDGLEFEVFERAGKVLEFLGRGLEEERYLHSIEPGGSNGPGFVFELGSRVALEHHAQAKVVFRGFGAEELRRTQAGDRCSGDAEEMTA